MAEVGAVGERHTIGQSRAAAEARGAIGGEFKTRHLQHVGAVFWAFPNQARIERVGVMIERQLHTTRIAQQHQRIHGHARGISVHRRHERLAGLHLKGKRIHIAGLSELPVQHRR